MIYAQCHILVSNKKKKKSKALYKQIIIIFLDARLKFVTISMVISLTICLIITHMQYGFGLIEDSFAADLNTEYTTSALFMTFYGICNFYVFTLAAVYSPTKKPGFGKCHSNTYK